MLNYLAGQLCVELYEVPHIEDFFIAFLGYQVFHIIMEDFYRTAGRVNGGQLTASDALLISH
jgi:hypothetical protein